MSEWPKVWHDEYDDDTLPQEGTEVVPADLARDLYDALVLADGQLEQNFSVGDWERDPALTRYEKEVDR